MNTSWKIRPYAPADRAAVRRICCDTADAGHPVEAFFDDRELIADLLMNYYVEFEPESAWVVERCDDPGKPAIAGKVLGYLTGCLDTGRFRRTMLWRIAPKALFRAFMRGTWWAAPTRKLIKNNWSLWWHSAQNFSISLSEYPAHLHINLQSQMQGQGIGSQLIDRFLDQLRAANIPGVHLSTREDNMAAVSFFEKKGFARLDRRPFLKLGPGQNNIRYSLIMAKKL